MVFQQTHLVPRRSVLDNVCTEALGRLPLRHSLHPRLFPRELREEAMACLDRVGLADRAHDRGLVAGRQDGRRQPRATERARTSDLRVVANLALTRLLSGSGPRGFGEQGAR
ncbi:hypothetical protein ACFVYP_41045 [Kitasatospora sp. NPDC058201]|uniref:hypothetical protein n=1 Tax=unclassified Kitasatospora TaxID=2633591 RepID=UPI00365A9539